MIRLHSSGTPALLPPHVDDNLFETSRGSSASVSNRDMPQGVHSALCRTWHFVPTMHRPGKCLWCPMPSGSIVDGDAFPNGNGCASAMALDGVASKVIKDMIRHPVLFDNLLDHPNWSTTLIGLSGAIPMSKTKALLDDVDFS